jgi:hypothetical protein
MLPNYLKVLLIPYNRGSHDLPYHDLPYPASSFGCMRAVSAALFIVMRQSEIPSQCHVTVTTSRRVIMTDRDVAATVG